MFPFILAAAALSGATTLASGMYGARREKQARLREGAAAEENLERQRSEELRKYGEDVSTLFGQAKSNLAAGNIKSTYLPNLEQQRMNMGRSNINAGYQGLIESIRRSSRM